MLSLVIQTILLIGIAFILGVLLGALLRNLFGSAEPETSASSASAEVEAVSASEATPAPMKAAEIPKPPVPTAPQRPAEKAKVVAAPPTPAKAKKGAKTASKTAPKAKTAAKPKSKTAAKVKVVSTKTTAAKAKSKESKSKPVASKTPDNLKLIRGIGPKNEGRLNALGVDQFAQIAAWKKKDVQHYGEVLNFPDRIDREEWVKQAKVLAKGGATKFSKRVKSGKVESSTGKTKAVDMGKKPTGLRTTARRGNPDKLTAIDGVGPAIEKKLNKIGVYHFDQISKMTKPQLAWLGNAVGFPGRPERENWVKDAKALALHRASR